MSSKPNKASSSPGTEKAPSSKVSAPLKSKPAATAAAAPVGTLHHSDEVDHASLTFLPTKNFVRQFGDGTATDPNSPVLETVWTLKRDDNSPYRERARTYTVKIRRLDGATSSLPYSLYNLAIQGRRWRVAIVKGSGDDLTLIDGSEEVQYGPMSGNDQAIGKVLQKIRSNFGNMKPKRVWFLNFSGAECTLELISSRPKPDHPPKDDNDFYVQAEHDTSPPPPEGGGEDGDEE